ncbi:hypothetical protein CTAYLR_003681 [Chrysophaeum taylorii]|uniref:Fe2OG dioxygenase domain-containing protein n=1 Tax=Chrysophaeum taylorii TaxID=2483200 RepID=A0AAD7XI17_9STRA|nr:hypothetical protein CTAYLR_003681 [Chrysophaeum taylorii]
MIYFLLVGAHSIVGAELSAVPVVDLSHDETASSLLVDEALRSYGFFYVRNHGVPAALVEAMFAQSKAMFSLPVEVKRSLAFVPHKDIGYLADQALDEDSGAQDVKEGFMLTNNAVFRRHFAVDPSDPLAGSDNLWPPLPAYEPVMRDYAAHFYALNHRLNALLFRALGLKGGNPSLARQPFFVLKQLRYAPSSKLGAGAHADWGTLTLLVTDGVPGLEIQRDGEWIPVPPKEGCVIVNAGDQITLFTAGRYKSANHRVRTVSPKERYSTAFFAYFDYHALVQPLNFDDNFSTPHAPSQGITTADYFALKLCESVGMEKASCLAPSTAAAAAAAATVGVVQADGAVVISQDARGDQTDGTS